ncbi:MAG: radical SAM protein [Candidatus Muiribacteriota bacterium]
MFKLLRVTPYLCIINLTTECNFNCSFCEKLKSNDYLSEKEFDIVVNELKNIGTPILSFSGGEPLLHKNYPYFFSKAKNMGFYMNLSTNASLINNDEKAKFLCDCFDTIRVSLHGTAEIFNDITSTNDGFSFVTEAIERLLKFNHNTRIGLNLAVNENNINDISNVIEMYRKRVDFISLLPVFSFRQSKNVKSINKSKRLLNLYKYIVESGLNFHNVDFINNFSLDYSKDICEAGRLFLAVMADGSIHSCPFTGKCKKFYMGNIDDKFSLVDMLFNFKEVKFSNNCEGCYSTCTTEVSSIFKDNIFNLVIKNSSKIKKVFLK